MNKKRVLANIFFALLITVLFGLVMAHELKASDFPQHIGWAKEYGEVGYLYKIPHTLFAKLVVIIRALLPANILVRISVLAKQVYDLKSYDISAWILMELCYLGTAWILCKRIIKEWKLDKKTTLPLLAYFSILVLLLVGPIFLFTFPERQYLGYFSPNPYHNPTYILFRPFVLLAFFGVADNLFAKWKWKEAVIACLAILCATLAKPSFTITFIPAIGLVFLLFHLRKFRTINWAYLFIPIGLTSLLVLVSQFFINYSGYWGDTIILAPFQAMLKYVPNIPLILLFGFLSILFPLLVAIFTWKGSSRKISFQLAWSNFLVALTFGYFVGEKINLDSNNFSWGVMIAVFLLFTESILIFGCQLMDQGIHKSLRSWKTWLMGSVLLLHLVCGAIYYVSCLTTITSLVK